MTRLIILFIIACLPSYAAIPSTSVWDARPGAGNNANGGAFNPSGSSCGTNFSTQNAAQVAFTDLVIGVTTTQLTSVLHPFDVTSPCNFINITGGAGCTTGWYNIVSVAVVTATMDRSVGTAASTCTGNLGGSLDTIAQAVTNAVAGNTIYFKGTYTVTGVQLVSKDNDLLTPFRIIGYGTTQGDCTKQTWTTSTNSINLIDVSSSTNTQYGCIAFTNTAGTVGSGTTGAAIISASANAGNVIVFNCSFDGFRTAIQYDWNVVFTIINLQVLNSEIKNSLSHGLAGTGSTVARRNFIHDNTGDGIHIFINVSNNAYNYTWDISHNVIYKNGGNGITNTSSQSDTITTGGNVMISVNSNDIATNTGDGVNSPVNHSAATTFENNIVWANGGIGYNSPPGLTNSLPCANAFGTNTGGARTNFPTGANDVAITVSPFVAIGSNFALNNTAGGGAGLRGTGCPGAIPNAGTGFLDIGALQVNGSGGGSNPVAIGFVQ